MKLLEVVLGATGPVAALGELKQVRGEMTRLWQQDLSLGEAGEVDVLSVELDAMLVDLRRVISERHTSTHEDVQEPDRAPHAYPAPGDESAHSFRSAGATKLSSRARRKFHGPAGRPAA